MPKQDSMITVKLKGKQVLYKFDEALKSYNKLRLKGKGTRDYYYLINVPKLYVGEKYCPQKRYSISFGMDEKGHQLVVIDLDDQKRMD